jgi:hypothetical protein
VTKAEPISRPTVQSRDSRGVTIGERLGEPSPRPSLPATRPRHQHAVGKDLFRDVMPGGQDGLVNILGIILGVMAGAAPEPSSSPPASPQP